METLACGSGDCLGVGGPRPGCARGFSLGVGAPAGGWASPVRVAGGAQAPPRTLLSSPVSAQSGHPVAGRVVREIDDPHSGNHWLLIDDPNSRGGPGRMILSSTVPADGVQSMPDGATAAGQPQAIRTQPMPVIHSGDRVVVEENTARVEVRLEAVALGPAVGGSPLNVRLTIGGSVVRTVALGPGRVAFAPETAARQIGRAQG